MQAYLEESREREQPIVLILQRPATLYDPRLDCFLSWREAKNGSKWAWSEHDTLEALDMLIKILRDEEKGDTDIRGYSVGLPNQGGDIIGTGASVNTSDTQLVARG